MHRWALLLLAACARPLPAPEPLVSPPAPAPPRWFGPQGEVNTTPGEPRLDPPVRLPDGDLIVKLQLKATPVQATSPLGINLDPPSYPLTAWPFIDAMKMTEGFISVGERWNDGRALDPDLHGWPQRLQPNQRAAILVPNAWSGPKVLLYDGIGQLRIDAESGPPQIIEERPGRIVFDPGTSTHMVLWLERTEPGDYIRNIRLVPEALERQHEALVFHPTFLERLRPFKILRFKDWSGIDRSVNDPPDSVARTWDSRAAPHHFAQATQRGVAYEWMILLANTLAADVWINIPHAADDLYVESLAGLLHQHLAPSSKIYVEWSNEVWNDAFQQGPYARQQGARLDANPERAKLRFQLQRSQEVFGSFERILGRQRLVRVLGGRVGDDGWLALPLPKGIADVWAINAFFGEDIGTTERRETVVQQPLEQLLKDLEQRVLPDLAARIARSKAVANQAGLRLVAYAGGQHLAADPALHQDDALVEKLRAANRHERMGAVYQAWLTTWKAAGGHELVTYSLAYPGQRWGNWGALERIDEPVEQAPKYRALWTIGTQTPRWW